MNTLTERNITYDRSGNLLTLDRYDGSSGTTPSESLSYSYSGPKRSTWTYDAHANVTADPQGGLDIEWNALDLPRTVTVSDTGTGLPSTQRAYLADGSLAQVGDGTTTRLYLGDIVFNKASNGTVTLESAGWEGGRLLPGSGSDKVLYTVADHLGSVRVVKDGMGNIRQRFDYYPYGTVSYVWTNSSTTDSSEKRYRFGGKEIAGSSLTDLAGTGAAPGASYLDFGARLYSPRTAMWLSPDPLMEKYYGVSPFVYCVESPVNNIDPDGSIVRDKKGVIIYATTGEMLRVNHLSGARATLEKGFVFADNGTPIIVYKNIGGDMGWDTNCHGVSFIDGLYWLSNEQVPSLLKEDGYNKVGIGNAKAGDIIIYHGESNSEHSMTVVKTNGTLKGTEVYGQGGLEVYNHIDKADEAWVKPYNYMVVRKQAPDYVATEKEIQQLKSSIPNEK